MNPTIRTCQRFVRIAEALVALVVLLVARAEAQVAPYAGELDFDGGYQLNLAFAWTDNLVCKGTTCGVELDVAIDDDWLSENGCIAFSDLPYFYDDCVTSGVTDPGGRYVFGLGSYSRRAIDPFIYYSGSIELDGLGLYAHGTFVEHQWQEVDRTICGYYDPWCMGAVDQGILATGYWRANYPSLFVY